MVVLVPVVCVTAEELATAIGVVLAKPLQRRVALGTLAPFTQSVSVPKIDVFT
jgi:hypothetical protein